MPNPILEPTQGDTLIIDGAASEDLQIWMAEVSSRVNGLEPLTGTGSPESVIISTPGRWYVDVSAGVGGGIYFKEMGEGSIGWVLRS